MGFEDNGKGEIHASEEAGSKKRAAQTFMGHNPLSSFQIKILGQPPNLSQLSLWAF